MSKEHGSPSDESKIGFYLEVFKKSEVLRDGFNDRHSTDELDQENSSDLNFVGNGWVRSRSPSPSQEPKSKPSLLSRLRGR